MDDTNVDFLIRDTEHLETAVQRVSFATSCLDMGWRWECRDVASPSRGWLIRCSFQRPDRETGTVGRGFGRWWYIADGTSESALWKTMFAAAKMIVEHELLEAFKVDGKRPFDPHRSVQDLTATASERA